MRYSRQDVELLLRAGLVEEADAALRELPDPVDLEQVQTWGLRHRISRDTLISRLGGNP
jgi:hypothetical protein